MADFFDRKIQLSVGDFSTDELRVDFEVEKSLIGYPNLSNIKIYNLGPASRSKIEERFQPVDLKAGYGSPTLLFSGDLINAVHLYVAPDWVTEIFAGDKTRAINESTINKTLPAGTTQEQIYNELVGQMDGISAGMIDGLKDCISSKRSILRSIQLSGGVKKFLDELAKNCGFDYVVADGVIDAVKKDKALEDEPEIVINQNTGMLGSPERTEVGVVVKTLLNPSLKLGRRIRIEAASQKINAGNLFFRKVPAPATIGTFRIDKIVHKGSLRDNVWESNITARNYGI